MANFATIKAGIVSILQADSDLANGAIYDYEPPLEDVVVDPFAVVFAVDNESEFETTTENKRTYNFLVRIFVERRNRGAGNAETLLTSIVDRLLDEFDQNYTLGVAGVLMTQAAPSAWAYILSDKDYRVAEIKLSTVVSKDVS